MYQKMLKCENKECIWWQDYSCSKKLITINKEGICTEVAKKKNIKNNQAK